MYPSPRGGPLARMGHPIFFWWFKFFFVTCIFFQQTFSNKILPMKRLLWVLLLTLICSAAITVAVDVDVGYEYEVVDTQGFEMAVLQEPEPFLGPGDTYALLATKGEVSTKGKDPLEKDLSAQRIKRGHLEHQVEGMRNYDYRKWGLSDRQGES